MSGMVPGIQMLVHMDNGKTSRMQRLSVLSGIPREGAEETPRVQVTGAVVEMAGQQVLLTHRIASLDGSITTLQVARVGVAGVRMECVCYTGRSVHRETATSGRLRAVVALERWERRR
jgi:hypothetical protein